MNINDDGYLWSTYRYIFNTSGYLTNDIDIDLGNLLSS